MNRRIALLPRTFGPSNRLEESIQGEEAARELLARLAIR